MQIWHGITNVEVRVTSFLSPMLLLLLLPASLTRSPESQLQLSLFKINFLWPLPLSEPPPELAPRFSSLTCCKKVRCVGQLFFKVAVTLWLFFSLTVMCSLNLRSGSLVFLVLLTITQLPDWSTLWSRPKYAATLGKRSCPTCWWRLLLSPVHHHSVVGGHVRELVVGLLTIFYLGEI